jgi:asparagine synthase (glutamine-hydrolysing)
MTASLDFRGPDANNMWINGSGDFSQCVGFGHTLLRTTHEAEHEQQPFTFDKKTFIVADCRIDARQELISKLNAKGRDAQLHRPDVELILHAWHVWGEECVEHLLGDFAFAIWDGRRLFCARDHMGVKPFYYAHIGSTVIFSNTLDCVRLHPRVSDRLNDLAVADFLLFERNEQFDCTTFADVRKLPSSHRLVVSRGSSTPPQRYWSLPLESAIEYKHPGDYVEQFRELFEAAVSDRLRTDRVSILMSGGLDSTAIAAVAHQNPSVRVQAHTMVYDRIMPDRERNFASSAAKRLNIPIHYHALDDYKLFERWEVPGFLRPEPIHNPLDASIRDVYASAAASDRVVLSGDGGDVAFLPSGYYLENLLKSGRLLTIARSVAHLWRTTHRVPPIGFRTVLKRASGVSSPKWLLPAWLNQDLAAELSLSSRWEDYWRVEDRHQPRVEARISLQRAYWPSWFEIQDAGSIGEQIDFRYPFFDRRLLEFVLRIPPIPWCVEKNMLRTCFRDCLPADLLIRPKSPLVLGEVSSRSAQAVIEWERWRRPVSQLGRFVDLRKLPKHPPKNHDELDRALLPLSLNWWLRDLENDVALKGDLNETARTAENCRQAV